MKSIFLENEAYKSKQFRSNDKLNALLSELKELLFPVQMTDDYAIQSNPDAVIQSSGQEIHSFYIVACLPE